VLLISTYDLGRQPFGLASPAAWLRRSGVEVDCVDTSREPLDDARIASAAVVAFYLPMHTATRLAAPLIDRVRAVNPAARLCAYGLYAPLNADWLRARGVTDVIGPELKRIADRHPSVGEVRGLGVFWAIELVRDRKTREPIVPFNASGADAKPMVELMTACKAGGVWPFAHFNRLQVTPPCTTSDDEVREGLAAIDKALEVADRYCKG